MKPCKGSTRSDQVLRSIYPCYKHWKIVGSSITFYQLITCLPYPNLTLVQWEVNSCLILTDTSTPGRKTVTPPYPLLGVARRTNILSVPATSLSQTLSLGANTQIHVPDYPTETWTTYIVPEEGCRTYTLVSEVLADASAEVNQTIPNQGPEGRIQGSEVIKIKYFHLKTMAVLCLVRSVL